MRLLCLWDFPGKNTGVGCHFFLQGIFLIQGLNPHLLHWQVVLFFFFNFKFIYFNWRLITLKYCIGFAIHQHESATGVHVPHPESPSHLPPHIIPLGHPSAPAPSILYPAGGLFTAQAPGKPFPTNTYCLF